MRINLIPVVSLFESKQADSCFFGCSIVIFYVSRRYVGCDGVGAHSVEKKRPFINESRVTGTAKKNSTVIQVGH